MTYRTIGYEGVICLREKCAKGDVLICRDAWQHKELTWLPAERDLLTVSRREFCWLCSRGGHQRTARRRRRPQNQELARPTYKIRNVSCRTLRESPDKKFVSYHKLPPLNYSCTAIIFYILFDSWESVGVKTVLWSWGNVGRRLTRRAKKLAVARPGFDCLFSLSSNRVGQQFFLPLTKQADNTKWQPISVWYMTSCSLWLCTALLCKICWQH